MDACFANLLAAMLAGDVLVRELNGNPKTERLAARVGHASAPHDCPFYYHSERAFGQICGPMRFDPKCRKLLRTHLSERTHPGFLAAIERIFATGQSTLS